MDEIIGHARILSFFERCISQGKLSHAYAFVGPRHVGKRAVAEAITRNILSITSTTFAHPDLVVVEREIDEKTGSLKKDISIGQIRSLISRFAQSAFVKNGYSVALIDRAEYLNAAAANALLKTLEEPRSKTVLILITEDEAALLPTIRSRVQSVYFSPVRDSDIASWITTQNTPSDRASLIIRDACGMPGRAVQWVQDPLTYDSYVAEKERLRSLFFLSFHEKIEKIEDFFSDRDDHIAARSRIIDTFRTWIFALRERMYEDHHIAPAIPKLIDTLGLAERQLKKNIHPRLVVEHVLLAIP